MFSTIYDFFSPILLIHFDQKRISFIDLEVYKKSGLRFTFTIK